MDRQNLPLHALPAGVLVVVTAADLSLPPGYTVLALLAVSPLVAATLVRRRSTAVYAVLAVVLAVVLGIWNQQTEGAALTAQVVRVAGVALAGVLALLAATLRLHRERELADATQEAAAARDAVALVEQFQRSLLTDPPAVPGLELAVRYLPAVRRAQVGGDWYDAFGLRSGATMLVIGDVAGHDVGAAATMAEARGLLRGIAQTAQDAPSTVLAGMDGALRRLRVDTLITAIVAVVRPEPGGALVRWSNAGHPPPLRVSPDGWAELLERAPELLLGVMDDAPRTDHELHLRAGETLLLYTDGLVERRGVPFDDGVSWLAGALAELAGRPLPELCDALLAGMSVRLADDVAVLAVRVRN